MPTWVLNLRSVAPTILGVAGAVTVAGLAAEYLVRNHRSISQHKLMLFGGRLAVYVEPVDLWIGSYLHPRYLYVCPLPMVVLRWAWADPSTVEPLDAAMYSVWRHGHWRHLTGCMTTPERDAAVAAVVRHSRVIQTPDEPPISWDELAWWDEERSSP